MSWTWKGHAGVKECEVWTKSGLKETSPRHELDTERTYRVKGGLKMCEVGRVKETHLRLILDMEGTYSGKGV